MYINFLHVHKVHVYIHTLNLDAATWYSLTHCICLLQVKYDQMHQALYDKRRLVVGSEYEPTDEECDFPSDDETDDEKNLSKDMEEKAKIDEKDENK